MYKLRRLIKKILNLLNLILFSKKIIGKPQEKKIIIFDCVSHTSLPSLFKQNEIYILSTRLEKIKIIYLSYSLLKFCFLNYFKQSLRLNYLIFLILQINPKVVITLIDNSSDFYIISKMLNKKIKFISLQQASRDIQWTPKKLTKKIYTPEFYCLGDFDKKLYLKKTLVKNIESKGSFKAAATLSFIKKKKIKIKKKFDICLISNEGNVYGDNFFSDNKKKIWTRNIADIQDLDHIRNWNLAAKKTAIYANQFANKYKLKLVIAGRGEKNSELRKKEILWWQNIFKKKLINIKPRNDYNFSNYQLILKSKVVIAMRSTLAREAIGFNIKVLWCHFFREEDSGYPFYKKLRKFVVNKDSYEIFEKKLKTVMQMSDRLYFKYIGKTKKQIMHNHSGYDKFILKRVNNIVKKKHISNYKN